MASDKGVILLDELLSPFGQRGRLALAEKGIKYESTEEDLFNKGELLLKSNPVYKKVPVLIHDGKPVCESLIILDYIDEVWSDKAPLLPSDPYQRAQARFWADVVNKFYECGWRMWTLKGEAHEAAKKELLRILELLEAELGDKMYYGGNNFGFVDMVFIPFTSWFHTYEICGSLSIETLVPNIINWAKRCMEREIVAKTLSDPKKIYEWVCWFKKRYGLE